MGACSNCGMELGDNDRFCVQCGTPNSASPGAPAGGSPQRLQPAADDLSRLPPPAAAAEQFVVTIGDIGVSQHWVVTPNGTAPVSGARFIVLDQSRTERKIPTWAIVLAIIFALACLLGLLFLLVKEEQTTGYVEVTVMSGTLTHVTQVPVSHQNGVATVRHQVHQAQSIAAAAAPS